MDVTSIRKVNQVNCVHLLQICCFEHGSPFLFLSLLRSRSFEGGVIRHWVCTLSINTGQVHNIILLRTFPTGTPYYIQNQLRVSKQIRQGDARPSRAFPRWNRKHFIHCPLNNLICLHVNYDSLVDGIGTPQKALVR